MKRRLRLSLIVAALAVLTGLLALACGDVSQNEYDAAKAQLQAKEQEVAQLRAQLTPAGEKRVATEQGVQALATDEKEHGQVQVQIGQLQPVPAGARATGWDTKWSTLLGITLMATFDSSGPDAWDVAKNPLVYVTSDGPGYAGFLSKTVKAPGIALINAETKAVITTAQFDTKADPKDTYGENHGAGFSADGKWIYTQGRFQGRDVALVINARTLKLDKILASRVHHARAYRDAATGKELVLIDGWGTFFALDPSDDNRVVGAVDPADLRGSGYLGFADPSGKELWISVRTGFRTEGGVAVVDLKTWKVAKRIATQDSSPIWVTFTNDGKYAYVSGGHESNVAKIDRAKGEVVAVARAGTEGPYGINLSLDEKLLVTIGKGEGSHNQGITVGLVDPVIMARPLGEVYTACLRADHAVLNPAAPNELWISCNSTFETVVFDMGKRAVTARIPMPDGGSNHGGSFLRYKPDGSAELLADTNGLHNSFFKTQAELLAKAAVAK